LLKREDLAHTGAHKINNATGQALLARRLGARRIVAETGAGQHGVASAAACARPRSSRPTPGVQPVSTCPVAAVRPCRTSRTVVTLPDFRTLPVLGGPGTVRAG